jgi:hypothetical protein
MVSNIDREDVLNVAEDLKIILIEEQVSKVMHLYPLDNSRS